MAFRPRKEFAAVEAQFDPSVIEAAMAGLCEGIKTGENSEVDGKELQKQMKLLARIKRLHARRDRYNRKRNGKKLARIAAQMRPEYLIYVLGRVRLGQDWVDAKYTARLMAGASGVDMRLFRWFLREMEIIGEMVNPSIPPHLVDAERAKAEAASEIPSHERRTEFELTLLPVVPPVGEGETVVQFPLSPDGTGEEGPLEEEAAGTSGSSPGPLQAAAPLRGG